MRRFPIPMKWRAAGGAGALANHLLPHQRCTQRCFASHAAPRQNASATHTLRFIRLSTNAKGITNLQLSRSPVNSLNLEFFQEINQCLQVLGTAADTKAVVVSSSMPSVFSAGLDLTEVHKPDPARLEELWHGFQGMWVNLNTFPKPIVAAITGNSPAGGCIVAMGCDYRVMARGPKDNPHNKRYRIGLNEVQVGLGLAPWITDGYVSLLGPRVAERLILQAEMPLADEALELGLLDEVVADEEAALAAAYRQSERYLAVPQKSRAMARATLRRGVLQSLSTPEAVAADTDEFVQSILDPAVQHNLGVYLDHLKNRARQ